MIWLFFEALADPANWLFTVKDGELYVVEADKVPEGAKIVRLRT